MWEKKWSEGVVKEAVWLSGVVDSFEEAEEVMKRVGHLQMSDSSIWRRVEKWGAEFEAWQEQKQAQANSLPKREEWLKPNQAQKVERMGVAMDGGMVHIRQEGWKELKAGCVYEIGLEKSWDKESKEWLELGRAVNNSYVAHLGGPTHFGQLLWAEAKERGWEGVCETQVMGDGAKWIWNLATHHFYDSRQSVDWYHSTDHLHTAAQLYHPDDPTAKQCWYNQAETSLFQGHADQIASDLRKRASSLPSQAEQLLAETTYFENNKRRMDYMELREDGYPIGSGVIESGIKQFKARFTGAGMRWSREGIERLIPIRASILSHNFDQAWASVYNSPKL